MSISILTRHGELLKKMRNWNLFILFIYWFICDFFFSRPHSNPFNLSPKYEWYFEYILLMLTNRIATIFKIIMGIISRHVCSIMCISAISNSLSSNYIDDEYTNAMNVWIHLKINFRICVVEHQQNNLNHFN